MWPKIETNPKILLIDDSPECLNVLEKMLRKIDLECETAANGHKALNLLSMENFDLIITDTNMPIMDGVDLLRTLHQKRIEIPTIIYFSGSHKYPEVTLSDLLCLGAQSVFRKPYREDELLPKIRYLLKKKRPVKGHFSRLVRDPVSPLAQAL